MTRRRHQCFVASPDLKDHFARMITRLRFHKTSFPYRLDARTLRLTSQSLPESLPKLRDSPNFIDEKPVEGGFGLLTCGRGRFIHGQRLDWYAGFSSVPPSATTPTSFHSSPILLSWRPRVAPSP